MLLLTHALTRILMTNETIPMIDRQYVVHLDVGVVSPEIAIQLGKSRPCP